MRTPQALSVVVVCILLGGCRSASPPLPHAPTATAPAGAAPETAPPPGAAPGSAGVRPPAVPDVAAAEPPPAAVEFSGGDGTTCEKAVFIRGAGGEEAGIQAENRWIHAHFPGYRKTGQALLTCNDKPVDQIMIVKGAGAPLRVYFDISDFFGKGMGEEGDPD